MLHEICKITGATSATRGERLQSLWSGYGELFRARLQGVPVQQVVVKHVHPPTQRHHPRGWNSSRSHERKLRSYDVERSWYRDFAPKCQEDCRVAQCLGTSADDEQWLFVLEDLDAAGFDIRQHSVSPKGMQACLRWLAYFHATFLGQAPMGLWPVGTYWHLETRPDELEVIDDAALVQAAPRIDARLSAARYQTLVHGDAKLANFCFSSRGDEVAAVDFQYVGGGCGMKDVIYLFSSALRPKGYAEQATAYLDDYFGWLRMALAQCQPQVDASALEAEWRALYPLAWADFYRFVAGWAPGHWKLNDYCRNLTQDVLRNL